MPLSCIDSTNPTGCNHYQHTFDIDGTAVVLHEVPGNFPAGPLTPEEREQLARLLLRRHLALGATWNALPNTEFTGTLAMLCIPLLATPTTKTNIGTSFTNVPSGLNGERTYADFTGYTQFRLITAFNLLGAGTQAFRVIDDANASNVLYLSPNQTSVGEKEISSAWAALPGWATGEKSLRLQANSTTSTDDPIYRRCTLYLK